jgi:hypothetical protein
LAAERYEDTYRALADGINAGDPRAIEVASKVLAHHARLLGYNAPKPPEAPQGPSGLNVHIHME